MNVFPTPNQITPNFLGLGVPRSGTTWIHKCFEDHPEASVPKTKYPNFREAVFKNDPNRLFHGLTLNRNPNGKKVGAIGTGCFYVATGERFLRRNFPDAKLFVCLRNPIDRVYSSFLYKKSKGIVADGDYDDFDEYIEHVGLASRYVQQGFYADHISAYMHVFKPEQFKVFLYDDLRQSPHSFIRALYTWIGVDPSYIPRQLNNKINPTTSSRLRIPSLSFYNKKRMSKYLEHKLGKTFMSFIRGSQITKSLNYILRKNMIKSYETNTSEQHPSDMREETRVFLRSCYQEDIEKTSRLIGRDLNHWI